MEIFLLRVFQRQVLTQCDYVLRAANDMDAGLKMRDSGRVFYGIQNLLTATANISKAFWGQKGKLAKQRAALRASVGVADDSPLYGTDMRNNHDHFDERLDRWWKESTSHNMTDHNLGPIGAIGGVDDIDRFRDYDPATTSLFFWGDEYNLRAIVSEVHRILPKLKEESEKPHWDPPRGPEQA